MCTIFGIKVYLWNIHNYIILDETYLTKAFVLKHDYIILDETYRTKAFVLKVIGLKRFDKKL